MNVIAEVLGIYWIPIKDGDPRLSAIYQRHYSCHQCRDGRRKNPNYPNRHLVLGPREKLPLLGADGRAILGWRKFVDDSGQDGVNCAFFRNEGALNGSVLGSQLILWAENLAWRKWPGARLYTYVDPKKVMSPNPGYTFKKAGWRRCAYTKNGLHILEKQSDWQELAHQELAHQELAHQEVRNG